MSYFMLNVEKGAWHRLSAICDGGIIIGEEVGNRNFHTQQFGI